MFELLTDEGCRIRGIAWFGPGASNNIKETCMIDPIVLKSEEFGFGYFGFDSHNTRSVIRYRFAQRQHHGVGI